jgi:pimeloyl-ACP methyl ester carboxylesterase
MGFPAALQALEERAPEPATLVALAPGRAIAGAVDGFTRRARLRPALVDELRRGIEARFGAEVWGVLDADRVVPGLHAAGLVIHDADDDEVPLADGRQIAELWPGAAFTTTNGLGHRRILRDEAVRALVVDALG